MPTDAHTDREKPTQGQILFALHSSAADDPEDRNVDAATFAGKLGALVRALKAADVAVNGAPTHNYTIARLKTSTPTALLNERLITNNLLAMSGIEAFDRCAQAITIGERETALEFGNCVKQIGSLAKGAERAFGYAEVQLPNNVIRIDQFLAERTKSVIDPEWVPSKREAVSDWFKGAAQGSFVGQVRAVDLRGKLPSIKLILSAGGNTIDCACVGLTVDQIRSALDNRVRVYGRAIYDGKSGLPRRVEVRDIEQMEGGEVAAWRGAFEPFERADWGESEH